jgi:chromosome segregation ATPase
MFTGTGGLLIAVNAVAGALPLLVNQLSETEDKMGDVSDAAEDAVSDIQQLASQALTIEGEGELDFQIPAERLQEANQIIETRVQALESIQEATPDVGGIIPARQFEQLGPVARQIVQDIQAQTDSLLIQEDAVQGRLEAAKGLSQELDTQVEKQRQRRQLLEELGIIADDNSETVGKTAENLQDVRQEAETLRARYEALLGPQGTALAQARRTKEQLEGQVEALQNVNRILARRESGIQAEQLMPAGPGSLGETPPVLQTIQDLSGQSNVLEQYAQRLKAAKIQAQGLAQALEDVDLAGSPKELGQSMDELSKGADDAADSSDEINNKLARSIQLAGRVGTTLEQAFERGEKSARDYAKVALPLIGQIVGTIIGGPAGGRIGGGVGQLAAIPFAEGGEVRGPGGPTEDQIPVWLSDREFVMQAESAKQAPAALRAMNDNPAVAQMVEGMVAGQAGFGEAATTSNAPMIVYDE